MYSTFTKLFEINLMVLRETIGIIQRRMKSRRKILLQNLLLYHHCHDKGDRTKATKDFSDSETLVLKSPQLR